MHYKVVFQMLTTDDAGNVGVEHDRSIVVHVNAPEAETAIDKARELGRISRELWIVRRVTEGPVHA